MAFYDKLSEKRVFRISDSKLEQDVINKTLELTYNEGTGSYEETPSTGLKVSLS